MFRRFAYILLMGFSPLFFPLNIVSADDYWVTSQDSKCKIWSDEAPTDKDVVTWTGGCAGGKASGEGKLEWKTGGKLRGTYEGIMKDGKFDNHGILKIAVDSGGFETAEGIFRNGRIAGGGLFSDADGNLYEGEIKDGKPHGSGYSKYKGEEYVGNFENGLYQGVGLLITDTKVYMGEFDKNKASGSGVMEDAEGGRYHGQFKDGHPHGFGTYTTSKGGVYQGQFVKGKAHGQFLVKKDANTEAVTEIWKDGEKSK